MWLTGGGGRDTADGVVDVTCASELSGSGRKCQVRARGLCCQRSSAGAGSKKVVNVEMKTLTEQSNISRRTMEVAGEGHACCL